MSWQQTGGAPQYGQRPLYSGVSSNQIELICESKPIIRAISYALYYFSPHNYHHHTKHHRLVEDHRHHHSPPKRLSLTRYDSTFILHSRMLTLQLMFDCWSCSSFSIIVSGQNTLRLMAGSIITIH